MSLDNPTEPCVSEYLSYKTYRLTALTDNRRHHTVPRFYLRHFAESNDSTIYQFDKDKNVEPVRTSIENVAVKRNYYSKERLSEFESMQAPSLNRLIENKSYYGLTSTDRENIRLFVWHMHMRTKQTRTDISSLEKQINRCYNTGMKINTKEFQTNSIKNESKFEHMHFTIMENMTDVPFWTSDNPVANFAIELHLPLTPKISLVLLNGRIFQKTEYVKLERNSHASYQNFLQLCSSDRFVYSHSKEFDGVRKMIQSVKNWENRSNGQYIKSVTTKPRLEGISSYEFEPLTPESEIWLRAVRNGTRFEGWSNRDFFDAMWGSVLNNPKTGSGRFW